MESLLKKQGGKKIETRTKIQTIVNVDLAKLFKEGMILVRGFVPLKFESYHKLFIGNKIFDFGKINTDIIGIVLFVQATPKENTMIHFRIYFSNRAKHYETLNYIEFKYRNVGTEIATGIKIYKDFKEFDADSISTYFLKVKKNKFHNIHSLLIFGYYFINRFLSSLDTFIKMDVSNVNEAIKVIREEANEKEHGLYLDFKFV